MSEISDIGVNMSEVKGQEVKQDGFFITKKDLQELLSNVMAGFTKMNPLEERKYQEELEKEKRRNLLVRQLGEDEEKQMRAKRDGCSHCIDKQTGQSVPRGEGIWNTQGQVHGNDVITLICMRCSTTWHFKSTPNERSYAVDSEHGLLHVPPPSQSRLLKDATLEEMLA